jgi:hypothetical protein
VKWQHLPGGVTRCIQVNPFLRLFGQRLSTWFRGSVLCRAIPPLQVTPGLNKFSRCEATFDIRDSSLGAEKTIRLQPSLNFPPEQARSRLGEYSLLTQQRAPIDNLPRFVGDPFISRTLPGGGGELHPAGAPHTLHQAACMGPGVGRWGIVASAFGIASFPPPPLHKSRQPELDDRSSSEVSGCLRVEIFCGRFPFPRSSCTGRRSISPSPSSSSSTSIAPRAVSPSIDRSVWTCQPGPWCSPVQRSSPLSPCAGRKD